MQTIQQVILEEAITGVNLVKPFPVDELYVFMNVHM